MDDLASKLNQILNSEEGRSKLQTLASMLASSGSDSDQNSGSAPDLSSLFGGGNGQNSGDTAEQKSENPLGNLDINMLLKLQQAMSTLHTEDKNTELLRALKPHFSAERAKKVDDAIRIMHLIKLLPVIKDSGLFGGDLF